MKELIKGMLVTARSPHIGLRLVIMRQFIKFAAVGVLNTMTSFIIYEIATRHFSLHPLMANPIAFIAAVTLSFTLNKSWTFRDRGVKYTRQYTSFFIVSAVGLAISQLIIFIVHTMLGIHDRIAFFIAVIVVMFWNFSANRSWTFVRE